jgi:uncharacterized damage-inducible protein DinB
MKNIIMLYATYNLDMDDEIIRLLSGFSDDELNRERNIFCTTITGLFNHLVRAGWHYQAAIRNISEGKYCRYLGENSTTVRRIEASFSEAAAIMRELDEGFVEFSSQVSEDDLDLKINRLKIYNGRTVTVSIWEIITQHMTHQIHHRGQLSQVLDELKIEHDIGNIWPYVLDSPKAEKQAKG